MRRCLLAFAIVLALGFGHAMNPPARAEGPAVATQALAGAVRFAPESIELQPGEQTTVDIWVDNVGDYYGIDLRVAYDPAVVQVPAGEATLRWEVFDGNPLRHFVYRNVADNEAGLFQYIVVNINPAQPFTGSGRLCSLTLLGVAPGTTRLSVTLAKATTRDGAALWPTLGKADIIVRGDPGHDAWWHGYLPITARP